MRHERPTWIVQVIYADGRIERSSRWPQTVAQSLALDFSKRAGIAPAEAIEVLA